MLVKLSQNAYPSLVKSAFKAFGRGSARDFWPHGKTCNCIGRQKHFMPFYIKLRILMILLTIIPIFVVLHAGLIYRHNCRLTGGGFGFWVKKYIYEAIWSLRFNLLISRKYKHFSDCTENCIESHSLHAPEMFSSVPNAKQRGESLKLLTKHSTLVIAEFEYI